MVSTLSFAVGAGSGVFIRVWANLMGKERKLASKFSWLCFFESRSIIYFLSGPWNLVACAVIGAAFMEYSDRAANYAMVEVNKERILRGLPAVERVELGKWGESAPSENLMPSHIDRKIVKADE